jgi:hypothetical protein
MTDPLRFVSYGGGVQSTGLLVLASQGLIRFDQFVLANVGDDSENPATMSYVREVAQPFAAEHGIQVHIVDRVRRTGEVETLLGRLTKPGSRSLPIPVRMSNGAPGTRSCTSDFKIKVIGKWAKAHGASAATPAVIGIGISADEVARVNSRIPMAYETLVYPLVGIGEETDLRMTRMDCHNLIAAMPLSPEHGAHLRTVVDSLGPVVANQLRRTDFEMMPVPPKSSCWFCPLHRPAAWDEQARADPELFERSCALEDLLNERRTVLGKDPVYFTRFNMPLRRVVKMGQVALFEDEDAAGCDSGWCMT